MVGYDKQHGKLTQFDFALAGGASGCITRAICQPLDVLKIRFQLQVEPISHKAVSKYRSIFQAIVLISQEEGLRAFWKGHIPAQYLSITYGIAQFWTFEVLSKQIYRFELPPHTSPLVNFSCGTVAVTALLVIIFNINKIWTIHCPIKLNTLECMAPTDHLFIAALASLGLLCCTATLVSFPFDVIRTRLVAQSEQQKVYEGIVHAYQNICKKEGPIVLFRGLWPTVLQIGPHAGAQFMCYKIFDDLYKLMINSTDTTLSSSLVAGSLAGLCAKTFIYPFDLAKKRMQVQGFEEARSTFGTHFKCKGLTDCLIRIYKLEGVTGYFKGLAPSLLKAVFTTALHFSSYEMVCNLLIYIRTKH